MIGIFNELYNFFYNWLFAGNPIGLTMQGAELATILMTCTTIVALLALVITPLKAILRLILR